MLLMLGNYFFFSFFFKKTHDLIYQPKLVNQRYGNMKDFHHDKIIIFFSSKMYKQKIYYNFIIIIIWLKY